jgi:glycosyltransferase involved in cell wall biosynthesis
MIRMCPYLQGHAAILKICDMDDLLSKRYRQLSLFPKMVYNIFGTFGNESIFRVLNALAKPMLRRILRIESRLLARREIDVALAVDLVLLVSPIEVKVKVLEGMAHAKPVVTNALGAEGISAQPGSEFLVAEDREGVVKAIIDLATNENLCRRVGAAATAYIAGQHDPLRLQKKLKEEVRRKLHRRFEPTVSL